MLTIRQLLIVSGQNPGGTLNTNALLAELRPRPLSLKSVISAFEEQRFVIFVSLVSAKILGSHSLLSMDDFAQAAISAEGQMNSHEVLALSSNLREKGLSLRLLDKNLRRAAIVGLASSLVNAPTIPLNNANLLKIQDKFSGGEAIGGAIAAGGAIVVGIGLTATAPVWVLPVGLVIATFGLTFTITTGVMDILHDSQPPPRSNSDEINSTPNDLGPDGMDGETIEIPNAVAIGSPPDDLNIDSVLQDLGDFSVDFTVDLVLSDLPVGFDTNTGGGLPGIPVENENDDGGDGGIFPFG
jgi:hypothetical protein